MVKTLYLSDLDGTLLRSDERVSEYTTRIINRFVQNGGCFSYATARSIVTSSKVTAGLNAEFPVICGNGAFIIRNLSNEILMSSFFTPPEAAVVYGILKKHGFTPMIQAHIGEKERLSYMARRLTHAMKRFLDNRTGDPRRREVETEEELYEGKIFRFACMDTEDSLSPLNDIFKSDPRFACVYQKEVYSGERSFEILPAKATKANAALQLKTMLGCGRIVAFGDGRNDLSLFSVADEGYATSNAVPELKEIATAVISSNDNDGVAKWIERNAL